MPTDDPRPLLVVVRSADEPAPDLTGIGARMRVREAAAGELTGAIAGAQVVLLWDFFSTALEDAWECADQLAWVHVAAAGVDRLLFPALVESDVAVTNARGVFDRPMAEFALMSILAHAKGAHEGYRNQMAHAWRHYETTSVVGRRALIVGTGSIGRETARLLRAVGLDVRGVGRTARADPDFGQVSASADLARTVGWADYVVVVTPLTDQTRGLVDAKVLAAMKPTAYLVNLGRGACVVEDDLIAALRRNELAGAALDVVDTEPLAQDHPLWSTPGVSVTPHLSGDARGSFAELADQFVDNAERFLEGRPLRNVVDKKLGFVPRESDRTDA